MNVLPVPSDCCSSDCSNEVQNIPGPEGPAGENGADGEDGSDGVDAFSETTSATTMPAVSSTVSVAVVTSEPFVIGEIVFIRYLGYMEVTSIPNSTHIVVENLGFPSNSIAGTIAGIGSKVSPSGERGETGAAGSGGATGPEGPQGDPGNSGATGPAGANSFSTLTSSFTVPAVGNSASAAVGNSDWMAVGQVVFISTGGYFSVVSKADSTHAVLLNTGYSANATPTTVIISGKAVSPSGLGQIVTTTAEQAIPTADATAVGPIAHNLGAVPQFVRWVLVCKIIDLAYAVGDEVDLLSASNGTDTNTFIPMQADATNILLVKSDWSTIPLYLNNKSTGARAAITPASWRAKAYCTRMA